MRAAGWTAVLAISRLLLGAQAAGFPVILLPGLAGSVLEAQLNRSSSPAWYCDTKADWRVTWLSLNEAARPVCLLDELSITYLPDEDRYVNQTGVEVRVRDFGGTAGIAALDPDLPQVTGTYDALIKGLQKAGWTPGVDLFGAPYDFRMAADGLEQTGATEQIKGLIEAAVARTGKPAALVAHSMGNLVAFWLISHQSPEWVKAHVGGFVSVSAPWLGSVTALKGSISGDNFDAPFIPHDLLRPLQSTAPSGVWLFPDPELWGDKVLVATNSSQYRAKDALQMLQDLGLMQQATLLPRISTLTKPLHPLDMPVFCAYGTGMPTEQSYTYDTPHFSSHAPDAPKSVEHGNGDGTVNIQSLEACKLLGTKTRVQTFPGASHLGLLREERFVSYVVGLLSGSGQLQQVLEDPGYRGAQFL